MPHTIASRSVSGCQSMRPEPFAVYFQRYRSVSPNAVVDRLSVSLKFDGAYRDGPAKILQYGRNGQARSRYQR